MKSLSNLSVFQLVLIGVFAVGAVLGVLAFSGILGTGGGGGNEESTLSGNITIWGTLPSGPMNEVVETTFDDYDQLSVTYLQKDPDTFESELLEALASGTGPDVVLFPEDLVVRHGNKIIPIPYETISKRDFRDTFAQEAELYLRQDGVAGVPLFIDPLVMYWNRDLYATNGYAQPPEYWSEILDAAQRITRTGSDRDTFKVSGVAMGEYRNIENAKEILAGILLQGGVSIVERVAARDGERLRVSFGSGGARTPSASALRLYTQFSNPRKTVYAWNRSLSYAQDMFVAGDLATYFGFASERSAIERRNAHLNYDVAQFPQMKDTNTETTYGRAYAVSVVKRSANRNLAYNVALRLGYADAVQGAARALSLTPARRDLLANPPNDAYAPLLYDSALISKGWLDPAPRETERIFRIMIEDVSSGRTVASRAVRDAEQRLGELISGE